MGYQSTFFFKVRLVEKQATNLRANGIFDQMPKFTPKLWNYH